MRPVFGKEITEPQQWAFVEGDRRREPVIDHNFHPPRVVRRVGYRKCMACPKWFWSDDVVRVRICDTCKSYKSD
jgi:hypothetical protein